MSRLVAVSNRISIPRKGAAPGGLAVGVLAAMQARGGLWFGAIDDLYALGTPRGKGGPWKDTHVRAGKPSDPYLMTGFEHKVVTLTHDQEDSVRFTIAVDVIGDGSWRKYTTIDVPAKESIAHRFPDGFSAHWVRLVIDRSAAATRNPCRAIDRSSSGPSATCSMRPAHQQPAGPPAKTPAGPQRRPRRRRPASRAEFFP